MATQQWTWNNFDYGISDTPERCALDGQNGSYQNGSYGIDTRSEP